MPTGVNNFRRDVIYQRRDDRVDQVGVPQRLAAGLASIALGNEFTAVVNALISRPPLNRWLEGANYYWFFTGVMLVAAVAYVGVASRYRGRSFPPQSS